MKKILLLFVLVLSFNIQSKLDIPAMEHTCKTPGISMKDRCDCWWGVEITRSLKDHPDISDDERRKLVLENVKTYNCYAE